MGGAAIPPVDYLDWYVARLAEKRPHDLSQSGFAHAWDLDADIEAQLGFWKGDVDPRAPVALRYGVDVEQVCVGHGVSQALTLAILAALPAEGARVVGVEMPSYGPVSQCARLLGCEVVPFERDVWTGRYDRGELARTLEEVSLIVLTPMLNPTGFMLPVDEQDWLVKACAQADVNIVSDEVYLDAATGTEFYRPMFELGDHCLSVNSVTKCYGLGPLRFGWVIGAPDLIESARRAFFNLQGEGSGPSSALAMQALPRLDEALDQLRANREANLPLLRAVLAAGGIEWNEPPTGIFGLIPLGTNALQAIDGLGRELGLLASPGGMFHAELANHLRVSWGSSPQAFEAAMPVLSEFLKRIQESQA